MCKVARIRTLYTIMNMSKLSLLLFIPFVSCMNTNKNNTQDNYIKTESKIETDETGKLNTLIKGTGSPTIIFESGLVLPIMK